MPRLGARCKLIAIYPAPIVPQNFASPLFLMSPVYYSGPCKNEYCQEETIPDKTTWESFPHHVHFPTQQNYFQNDAFAERKPLPPIQCCFPQTPRDQAFFWIHKNIAFRGGGEERTGTATMLRKMLSKYTIFSTVLSKIVAKSFPEVFLKIIFRFTSQKVSLATSQSVEWRGEGGGGVGNSHISYKSECSSSRLGIEWIFTKGIA